jgi:hypothetical protein
MAQIQCVAGDSGTGATTLQIALSATAAGSFIGFGFSYYENSGAITVSSVTDSASQSYTQATSPPGDPSWVTKFYYFEASTAGVTWVRVTFNSSTQAIGFAMERDDVAASSALDVVGAGEESGLTFPAASWDARLDNPSQATSVADTIGIMQAVCTATSSVGFTAASPWTAITGTGITAGCAPNSADGDTMFMATHVFDSIAAHAAGGSMTDSRTTNIKSTSMWFKLSATGPAPRIVTPTTSVSMGR